MHLSLVPRHDMGENIFLPKQRVPFCEFFQSVFAVRMYTRLSYWIKAKGMESRAFLPCLLVSDACGVLSLTCGRCLPLPHPLLSARLSLAPARPLVSAPPGPLTEVSP